MKNMFATDGSAQVLICPDGTFVFDQKAVAALRLHDAHSISVCYSTASEQLALQAVKANGCDRAGVPLERRGDRMVAFCAADFLQGAGVLPSKPTKYDAEYYAHLHTIVIKNVAITKRRKTA